MYGKPVKREGRQELFFPYKSDRYFSDTRLKIDRLPNFNMLFLFLVTKFFESELFSCLQKVDHVINSVMQKAYHLRKKALKYALHCHSNQDQSRFGKTPLISVFSPVISGQAGRLAWLIEKSLPPGLKLKKPYAVKHLELGSCP